MEPPIHITYRGLDPSDALNRLIHDEAAKLGKFFDGIVTCRIAIDRPDGHHRHGAPYHVHVTVVVPGAELAATSDEIVTQNDPALSVRDAFRRAKRRVREYASRKHDPHGRAGIR